MGGVTTGFAEGQHKVRDGPAGSVQNPEASLSNGHLGNEDGVVRDGEVAGEPLEEGEEETFCALNEWGVPLAVMDLRPPFVWKEVHNFTGEKMWQLVEGALGEEA